jgi:hypothetical protein
MKLKALGVFALASACAFAQLTSFPLTFNVPNDATTGTQLYHLAMSNAAGNAILMTTSDSDDDALLGVVALHAGISGSAAIATSGQVPCVFDGATTINHYVQKSTTIAGDCHDVGATYPGAGRVLGQVRETHASGGTYQMISFPSGIKAVTGGGGGGGTVTAVSVAASPAWLNASVNNSTTTPSLTIAAATGQTAHQVIGTGAGASFAPIALSVADLPTGYSYNSLANLPNLAASATTDTTNAANISSGTLPAARLPNPSASTLGGVQSAVPTTHAWVDSISTSGVPHVSQPGAADVTGLSASATTDTTNAANITSGTLASGRLPATVIQTNQPNTYSNQNSPSTPASGSDVVWTDVSDKNLKVKNDTGAVTVTVAPASAVTHQFVTAIAANGTVSQAQPAAADVTGLAASATTDATNAANITAGTLASARLPGTVIQTNQPNTYVNQAAPATPSAGSTMVWTDSTDKNIKAKNDAGTVSVTVQPASAVSHQFVTAVGSNGAVTQAQPAAADVTGLATSATTDTTNAANITSGTIASARLPGTLIQTTQVNTYTNQAAPATPATGSASVWTDTNDKNLKVKNDAGAVTVTVAPTAATTHQFVTAVNADGSIAQAQPAAADVTGLAASATIDTTNAANITTGTFPTARMPNLVGAASGPFGATTLRDISSAKDAAYGAIGNGSANDGPAINSYLASGNTVLNFPQGTYITNVGITGTNIQINLPKGSTIKAGPSFPANTPLISSGDGALIITGGGTLDGNNVAQNCAFIAATNPAVTTSVDINGITCQNAVNNGIYAKNTLRGRPGNPPLNGVKIRNSYFKNIGANAYLTVGAINVDFSGNTSDTTCTSAGALSSTGCDGVAVSSSANVVITNNRIINNTPIPSLSGNPAADMYLFGDYNATITNNVLMRDPATAVTCTGNLCNVGLYFDTVINGVATGNAIRGGQKGARVEVSKDFTFNDNTIADPFGYGLLVNTRAYCTSACGDTDTLSVMDATTNLTAGGNITLSNDTADKKEGTGSLVSTFGAGFTTGPLWTFDSSSQPSVNWSISPETDLWVKPSVTVAQGVLNLQNVNANGTLATIPLPAMLANTWVRVELIDPLFGPHMNGTGSVTSLVLMSTANLGTGATVKTDYLVQTVPYDHVVANNNTIQRTQTDGIQIQGALLNSTFHNNTIQDPGATSTDITQAAAGINYGPFNAGEVSYGVDIQGNTVSQRVGGGTVNTGIKVQSHGGALIVASKVLNNNVDTMPVPTTITVDSADTGTMAQGLGTMNQATCARSQTDGSTNCDTNIGSNTFNTNLRYGRQSNFNGGVFALQIFKHDGTSTLPVSLVSSGTSRINGDGAGAFAVGDSSCTAGILFCAGTSALTQKVTVDTATGSLTGNSAKFFGSITGQGGAINLNKAATADGVNNSLPSPLLFTSSLWTGTVAQQQQFKIGYSSNTTNGGVAPTFETLIVTPPTAIASYDPEWQFGQEGTATSGANFPSMVAAFMGTYWNGTVSSADRWKLQDILGAGINPTSTLNFAHVGSTGAANVAMPALTVGSFVSAATHNSATANPAASGVFNLAATDKLCWRNAANTGDVCVSKDSSDNLSLPQTSNTNLVLAPTSTATSSNNFTGGSVKWGASVWNGSAAVSNQWTMGRTVSTTGAPTFDILFFTPPSPIVGTNTPTIQLSTLGTATSGANFNSPILDWQSSYWNGSAGTQDQWFAQSQLGAGTNPTTTLSFTHSGTSGTAAVSVPSLSSVGAVSGTTFAGTAFTGSSFAASGAVNGATFNTVTANPATTGVFNLSAADKTCWRNAGNTADVCLSKNGSDALSAANLTATSAVTAATHNTATANPATTGIFNLAAADKTCWRNAGNTADVCLSKNASDALSAANLTATSAVTGATHNSATANPATTGVFNLAAADKTCWRNAGNTADVCISKDGSDNVAVPTIVSTGLATVGSLKINGGQTMTQPPNMTWAMTGVCSLSVAPPCRESTLWTPPQKITLTKWWMSLQSAANACTTYPSIALKQGATTLATIAMNVNNQFDYSTTTGFPINIDPANGGLQIVTSVAAATCTATGSNPMSTIDYVMQ